MKRRVKTGEWREREREVGKAMRRKIENLTRQ